MFRFNISEEIIFKLENMDFGEKISEEDSFFEELLTKLNDEKIFICYGLSNELRERFCFRIIYKYFNDRYVRDLNIGVFKISSVGEFEEIYLENEFQIFYFYDFFGSIKFNDKKFGSYLNKIKNSNNKMLVVNTRSFLKREILESKNSLYVEDLEFYKDKIEKILNINLNCDTNNYYDLDLQYQKFDYIDKLVLFYVFINFSFDVNKWIGVMEKYLVHREIFNDHSEFKEMLLNSFRKLEDSFINIYDNKKFNIKNPIVYNFILSKLKNDIDVIKDLFNNIYGYEDLYSICNILSQNNVRLCYTLDEYENNLKSNLCNVVFESDYIDVISMIKTVFKAFYVLDLWDIDIIEDLNFKITYSKLNIDGAIDYFFSISEHREFMIKNEIFKSKLLNLIYEYEMEVSSEFYNYSFKYYLFVSEFYRLYGNIDNDELTDLKYRFNVLISIVLNNINSYFNIEYFNIGSEIRNSISDLKDLIKKYDVRFIFGINVCEVFDFIEDKLSELIYNADNFIPKDMNDYYNLKYFGNELERNEGFIEEVFHNINMKGVIERINEKICLFEA